MKLEALLRAAEILRAQPAYSMPLATLHARLLRELGPDVGSYAQVYLQLKNRPQSFVLLDEPKLLEDSVEWPQQVRVEYDTALAGAGLGSQARVALAELPEDVGSGGALAIAGRSLSALWPAAKNDPLMRDLLNRAAQQIEEISELLSTDAEAEPTTTQPPDPRP